MTKLACLIQKMIVVIIATVLGLDALAQAADTEKVITIIGKIHAASFDSVIESKDGDSVIFLSDSDTGNKIFSVCGHGDMCEITGVIVDRKIIGKVFLSVSNVKYLKEVNE